MLREAGERAVPLTPERLATALVQARANLVRAVDEVLLAARICRELDGAPAHGLEEVVARLEEVELQLNQIALH